MIFPKKNKCVDFRKTFGFSLNFENLETILKIRIKNTHKEKNPRFINS